MKWQNRMLVLESDGVRGAYQFRDYHEARGRIEAAIKGGQRMRFMHTPGAWTAQVTIDGGLTWTTCGLNLDAREERLKVRTHTARRTWDHNEFVRSEINPSPVAGDSWAWEGRLLVLRQRDAMWPVWFKDFAGSARRVRYVVEFGQRHQWRKAYGGRATAKTSPLGYEHIGAWECSLSLVPTDVSVKVKLVDSHDKTYNLVVPKALP